MRIWIWNWLNLYWIKCKLYFIMYLQIEICCEYANWPCLVLGMCEIWIQILTMSFANMNLKCLWVYMTKYLSVSYCDEKTLKNTRKYCWRRRKGWNYKKVDKWETPSRAMVKCPSSFVHCLSNAQDLRECRHFRHALGDACAMSFPGGKLLEF